MSVKRFEYGEQIRHMQRPEWGVGQVMRVEELRVDGAISQRLTIRFANAGRKTLSTAHAPLERLEGATGTAAHDTGEESLATIDADSGLLGETSKERILEVMTRLPLEIRDPFSTMSRRLRLTFDLFRFDRSGRGLMDWAVAQSGLSDPLSRFSRQELEAYFERWARERDIHLAKILESCREEPRLLDSHLANAPAGARQAVQRLTAVR
jgi:hypothetical protein